MGPPILGLRNHQLRWLVGQLRWGALRGTLFRRNLVSEPDLRTCSVQNLLRTHPSHPPTPPATHTARAHPSTRSLRTHTRKRPQGCLPNPPDTEGALTHPSLSACVPACVWRLRPVRVGATRASHRKPIRPKNASPAARPSPPETRGNMKKTRYVRCFPHSGGRACARKAAHSIADLSAMSAYRQNLLSKGNFWGCRGWKGCWNAQMLVMQECRGCWRSLRGCRGCWRGCWRLSGAICSVFTSVF